MVVDGVRVGVGITHLQAGQLTIKLRSPEGTVAPLMSRPGYVEPADDGSKTSSGDASSLSGMTPVWFVEGGMTNAEDMGATIDSTQTICADDSECEFDPSSGSAAGNAFEDYLGETVIGEWMLCVGDSLNNFWSGTLESIAVTVYVTSP